MSDDPVRTRVRTNEGWLDFQHYFVRRRCEPAVEALEFAGAASARMAPGVVAALADPALAAIIICPSNPYLSVDPILAVPGMREALRARRVPALAVSPIIAGQAVKGPTAKMMAELGLVPSAATVAHHYEGLIDGFVVDTSDADVEVPEGMRVFAAPTLMRSLEDRINLARTVLAAAAELAGGHGHERIRHLGGGAGEGVHARQEPPRAARSPPISGRPWCAPCWRTCSRPWRGSMGWPDAR